MLTFTVLAWQATSWSFSLSALQKEGLRVTRLNYWVTKARLRLVLKQCSKEEPKTPTPLFSVPGSCLGALVSHKPLDSSRSRGHSSRSVACCVPHFHGWELKSPVCFLQTLSLFFFFFFKFGFGGREGQDSGRKDSNHQEGVSASLSPPTSLSMHTEVFSLLINT